MPNKVNKHYLRINPRYAKSLIDEQKNFELCQDKGYQVDDVLVMYYTDEAGAANILFSKIKYILKDLDGLNKGWCILVLGPNLKHNMSEIDEDIAMVKKLVVGEKSLSKDNLNDKEKAVVSQAKDKDSLYFLKMVKKSKNAVIIRQEHLIIDKLREMGLPDEVINMIVLFAFNKVDSANLNENYIMKVANDFNFKGVKTAEDAAICLRGVKGRGKTKTAEKSQKTNVPSWSNPDYKNTTTPEEKEELEKEFQRLMQKLDNIE